MDKEQAIVLAKRYKEMVAERLPLKALSMARIARGITERIAI